MSLKGMINACLLVCSVSLVSSFASAEQVEINADDAAALETITQQAQSELYMSMRPMFNECDRDPTGSSFCRGRNFCGLNPNHPKCNNYCSVQPYDPACRGNRGADRDRRDDRWGGGGHHRDPWGRDRDRGDRWGGGGHHGGGHRDPWGRDRNDCFGKPRGWPGC